ncbi:MAG: NUDIX hydrolase, partial [Limisphaerales bacterium]
RLGLLHRAVHILVFNPAGKVFLQKRSASKDTHPLTWDSSTSGHVDAGEDYDESAVRELQEEIGLALAQAPERLFKIDACDETDQEFVWVYRTESEGPFTLHPAEIVEGGWFDGPEISAWIHDRPEEFAPAFAHLWRIAKERGQT